jgi:DNA helicase II / ATP-dependent DNA helicase PcrA
MSSANLTKLRPKYLEAAEELRDNPGQWKAYESTGHCVVLAGPGSGKTKTLTIKLARMLTEDIQHPRGVACITYNTECAGELKRRLDRLGVQESKNIYIGTIHSFCLKNVLLPYASLVGLGLPKEIAVASPSEQTKFFGKAVAKIISPNVQPDSWRTGFDHYRRTFLDREAPEWQTDEQTAALIEAYEKLLRENGLIDFDDMVLLGLRLIEQHSWVGKAIRARFPVLAVDEYQDLGVPLHRIVMKLCFTDGVRLLGVGDPDQSIYGFTGAQPELLSELAKREDVEEVILRFNYRSGKNIVEASKFALGEERDYEAKGGYAGTVNFYKCPDGLKQQAEKISNRLIPAALKRREGRQLGDVAVLYLDKNDGNVIEKEVVAAGMKCIRVDNGAPYRKTLLIRWLEECAAWCAGGWKSGTPRLSGLLRTWFSMNVSTRSEQDIDQLKVSLVHFLLSHRAPDVPLQDWLADFHEACLNATLAREKALRDEVDPLTILVKACSPGGKLQEFTVGLFGGQSGAPDHLNLVTLHSAKGREFDVVIMMGMEQGRIPSWAATKPESKREPRRLFYVGLTRARHEVHLTFSGFTTDKYDRRHQNGPSEFLIEVAKRIKANSDNSK